MLRQLTAALAITCFLLFCFLSAAGKPGDKPQVIRPQRFRKALDRYDQEPD